jgi:hypothetical protein
VLAPERSVALERDRNRPEKIVGNRFGHLDRDLRWRLAGVGHWIETGKLTAEATVDEILEGAKGAQIPAQPPPSATS